ncbi:hypothetical protein Tco_0450747, partial [Tanacetum coccineum]
CVETASRILMTPSKLEGDDVMIFGDAIAVADLKEDHGRFSGLMPSRITRDDNLALYDHESWNDPKDLSKPVKAISLPQNVPSTSDRRFIELENQVQRLMEAHLGPKPSVQVNKTASSCEIYGGPYDTQICMENLEQAFVNYAFSHNNEVGGKPFTANQGPRNFGEATNAWKDKPNFN